MSLSPPIPPTELDSLPNSSSQLDSTVDESSDEACRIFGIKLVEIDEEDVENRGINVVKILGVVVGEREKMEVFYRNRGIKKEDITNMRTPSCAEEGWAILNSVSLMLGFICLHCLGRGLSKFYETHILMISLCSSPLLVGPQVLLTYMQKRCLGMPFRLIGRVGILVGDGIALVAAFILWEAFPYDGSNSSILALLILVCLTLYLHSWLKVIHHAYDISLRDVLLEMTLQAAIYISTGHDIVCFLIVLFFCGVMCYKYISYPVPITLEDRKKDVDLLPV